MKTNNVQNKTMFQELIDFLNERIDGFTNCDEVALHLFQKGYLVKNLDGSIYDASVRHYLVKLKQCKANYESIAEDYFDLPTDYG